MSKIEWKTVREFEDITYKKCNGVARIAFNRPDVRNAFRPKTTKELIEAFYDAQEDTSIGVVLLSAEGPSSKDGIWSFCSGGDQKARGHQGYVGEDGYHRLNILEVQRMIRFMPKAVICVVPGWAVGGGHSLHVVCDLTLASKEHAIFKGHFPGNPVTPGVCMMQIIKELSQEILGSSLILKSSSNVKFMALINPEINPKLKLELDFTGDVETEIKVKNTTFFDETVALKLFNTYKKA